MLRISGGEIASWLDYWNPLEIIELQGLLPDLISHFAEEDNT